MDEAELTEALLELAKDAGLEVRWMNPADDREPGVPTTSGVCRVRDRIWVLLSQADPAEVRLDVLAAALRTHAAAWMEGRYLAPAVRERITGENA